MTSNWMANLAMHNNFVRRELNQFIPVHVAEFLLEVIDKMSFMYHDDNDLEDESPICQVNDDHTIRQSTPVLGWGSRVMSLFQILFYNVQKGNKKTPMHLMTTHCIHEKCKSRKLITGVTE